MTPRIRSRGANMFQSYSGRGIKRKLKGFLYSLTMLEHQYKIFWSIYVAGNDPSKARRKQLPEIEKRIELVPEKWLLEVEELNPDMVRFMGSVILEGLEKQDAALWALDKLSRLASVFWQIGGLSTIQDDSRGLYLYAMSQPKTHFPALTSVLMELEQIEKAQDL